MVLELERLQVLSVRLYGFVSRALLDRILVAAPVGHTQGEQLHVVLLELVRLHAAAAEVRDVISRIHRLRGERHGHEHETQSQEREKQRKHHHKVLHRLLLWHVFVREDDLHHADVENDQAKADPDQNRREGEAQPKIVVDISQQIRRIPSWQGDHECNDDQTQRQELALREFQAQLGLVWQRRGWRRISKPRGGRCCNPVAAHVRGTHRPCP
mmetsp:Transcript_118862/g.296486  ORF Transcript_118862/g.296486 Transcript_118862/m.296486 type:complete len:213 (-) Transcript_118862:262-900(-)